MACGHTVLRLSLLVVFDVFSALNSTLVVFYNMFELVGFMDLNWVFHGHVGPCRKVVCIQTYFWLYICTCIYIFMGYAANLCDAGCSCMCLFCFGFCVGFVSLSCSDFGIEMN